MIKLSILIATYKRKKLLMKNLSNVLEQVNQLTNVDRLSVEIIVSVNPSGDGTEEYLLNMPKYDGLKIHINKENVGAENNMLGLIHMSNGKFIWLVSDDDELAPGLVSRVINVINAYNDLGWIYINSVSLSNGNAITSFRTDLSGGYFENGKQKLEEMWSYMPGNILFQTSNIYLRESSLKDEEKLPLDNACRWPYNIFNSILNRSAYVISEPSVLQGAERTWTDRFYQITCYQFQEMILTIGSLDGYDEHYAKKLLRYYMKHEGLVYWIYLFKWMQRNPKQAKKAYMFYISNLPFTTLIMTFGLPFEIIYLGFRHYVVRALRRKKRHYELINNKSMLPNKWKDYIKE